jgi:hypothetical protein
VELMSGVFPLRAGPVSVQVSSCEFLHLGY